MNVVGKSIPRVDGWEKVTGQAIYAVDMKIPGVLYAKVLRSPHAHARILTIDTSRAERLPGARAVHYNTLLPSGLDRVDKLCAALDGCAKVKVYKG